MFRPFEKGRTDGFVCTELSRFDFRLGAFRVQAVRTRIAEAGSQQTPHPGFGLLLVKQHTLHSANAIQPQAKQFKPMLGGMAARRPKRFGEFKQDKYQ